jgi:hypothetical protein
MFWFLCISSVRLYVLRQCGDRNASWSIASAGLRGTLHIGGSCVTTSFMACYDIYPVELCAARGCLSLLFFKCILFNTRISGTACDNMT